MLFVYAVLVWLGISLLLAAWILYQHILAKRHKPPPVDRNGIELTKVTAPATQPVSYLSLQSVLR